MGIRILLATLLLTANTAFAQNAVTPGLSWLLSQQDPDGGFGLATGENRVAATSEALLALRVLGRGSSPEARAAETFLSLENAIEIELAARRVHVLRDTGLRDELAEQALRDLLTAASTGTFAGLGFAPGYDASDAWDIGWILRALTVSGAPIDQLLLGVARKVAHAPWKMATGCYAYADNDGSVGLTAHLVDALIPFVSDSSVFIAQPGALACLYGAQRPDGSFGEGAAATASVLVALLGTTGANPICIENGRGFLLASQQGDGAWDASIFATALALQSLGQTAPDLRITTSEVGTPLLIVNNPQPLSGEALTASLNVENYSANPAPVYTVRFVAHPANGGADVVLADTTQAPLPAGQIAHLTASLSTDSLSGRYTLRAIVNPDQLVPEINFLNNEADAQINVLRQNDLAISSSDIHFMGSGNNVSIQVSIHNLGITLPISVGVSVYRGNPTSGGVLIGTTTLPAGLLQNQIGTVSVPWNAQTANGPKPIPIFAMVDQANILTEANKANNTTFRYYYAGAGNPVDLAISTNDMSTSPSQPTANIPFTLLAQVHNQSAFDASSVPVAVYGQDGSVLGQTTLFVPANGAVTASFPLQLAQSNYLTVVVDPNKLVNDSNRANNSVQKQVVIGAPEFNLALNSLSANPSAGSPGTQSAIQVTAANSGSKSVQTQIRLTQVADGSQLASVPVVIQAGGYKQLTVATIPIPQQASALQACIDPFHAYADPNPNDNCAQITLGSGSTDLGLTSADLSFSPPGADIGEKVHIAATIHNYSSTAASAVVQWWHGRPSLPEGTMVGMTPIQVPANGQAIAGLDWIRQGDLPEIYAKVDQVTPRDTVARNNTAGRHLFLQETVDLGFSERGTQGSEIRVGRVTGAPIPDLVIGYEANSLTEPPRAGVALLTGNLVGGHSLLWTRDLFNHVEDVVLGDLDNDDIPEVTVLSKGLVPWNSSTPQARARLTALEPDGSIKWDQTFDVPSCAWSDSGKLAAGDVNNDGIIDLVFLDTNVTVFSGLDGSILWTYSIPTSGSGTTGACSQLAQAAVIDLNGDGSRQVLVSTGSNGTLLLDASGTPIWRQPSDREGKFALVDLDLDGYPEMVHAIYQGALHAWSVRTGQAVITGDSYCSWAMDNQYPVGDLRQNGLPYRVEGSVCPASGGMPVGAFTPDLHTLWNVTIFDSYSSPFVGVLADIIGLGRPQFISGSDWNTFILQDGRDGRILTPPPVGDPQAHYADQSPLFAADVYGNNRSSLVQGYDADRNNTNTDDGKPAYGTASALIFSSPHWKKTPKAWPTSIMVHGQIDDDLHFTGDYQPWKTHNTWNDQFVDRPSILLADLEIKVGDVTAGPTPAVAGDSTTLTATVRNVGGLTASNIKVTFFDGDPHGTGVSIGEAYIVGPLAKRTGTASATITWTAYPEGQHQIYAVANLDQSIEESGYENNTGSMQLFVRSGSQLCDLALDPTSLAFVPTQPNPSDPLNLLVTAINRGTVVCAASLLTVYDGDPAAGGSLVGSTAIPALSPNQTASLSLATTALSGSTFYRFVADQDGVTMDGDRGNNTVTMQVTAPDATIPHLIVKNLVATPNPAYPGQAVQMSATVTNLGALSSPVEYVLSMDGAVASRGTLPTLVPGDSVPIAITVIAPSSSANLAFNVDPSGTLPDVDPSNHSAQIALQVVHPNLTVSLATDSATYTAGGTASIRTSIANLDLIGRSLRINLSIELDNGASIQTLDSATPVIVDAQSSTNLQSTWSVGVNAPGVYRAHLRVTEGSMVIAEAIAGFSIVANTNLFSQITVDQASYAAGTQAIVDQYLRNDSANAAIGPLTTQIFVGNTPVLFNAVRQVPPIPKGKGHIARDLFEVSQFLTPGSYPVTLTITDAQGTLVGSSASTLHVAASQPTQALRGQLATEQSAFYPGRVVQFEVTLTNSGNVAINQEPLDISILDAQTLATQDLLTVSISLAVGESKSLSVEWTSSSGLPLGDKLAVLRVEGLPLARTLIRAVAPLDLDPPTITVSGISEGQITNSPVTPIITVNDASAFTTSSILDNAQFVSGTEVNGDGAHTLVIYAADVWGNASSLTIHFTIDRTPPTVSLTGIEPGKVTAASVTVSARASDDHLEKATVNVNGATSHEEADLQGRPFSFSSDFTSEGEYSMELVALDSAGNRATSQLAFAIDRTAPSIVISGVHDKEVSASDLIPTFVVSDSHLSEITATIDDAIITYPFISGTLLSLERDYVLRVSAQDAAGNQANSVTHFAIDKTPPTISINGISEGQVSATALAPQFVVDDAHSTTVSAVIDDGASTRPYASGMVLATEANYVLTINSVDSAGNSASSAVHFAIDTTVPDIIIAGVADGEVRAGSITPTFTVTDLHPGDNSAWLRNGSASVRFTSGTTLTAEGGYQLEVDATDAAGNSSTKLASFAIDRTAPTISIAGFTNGAMVNRSVSPTFAVDDLHPDTVVATLNGENFTSGQTVSQDGSYSLTVIALDRAGNRATQAGTFTIDKTAPIITLAGFTNGQYGNQTVAPTFQVIEQHPSTVVAKINGQPFVSGTPISSEGTFALTVTATDAAGNYSTASGSFTIDNTPPVITVTGVAQGQVARSFTIGYSANDANLSTISATLDGVAFSGGTVTVAGSHALVVVAADLAGNTASTTIGFEIGTTDLVPQFHFAACAVGNLNLANNARVMANPTGPASVAANGNLTMSNNASISGDAVCGGTALLQNNVVLSGTLYHGGALTRKNHPTLNYDVPISPAPQPCGCDFDLNAALNAAQGSNDNALLQGQPYFVNGAISLSNSCSGTLPSGRFYVSSVLLQNNSTLSVESGATVTLYVQGNVTVRNNSRLGIPFGQSGSLLVLSGADSANGGIIDFANNGDATLSLFAPHADLNLSNNAKVFGAIVGRNITLQNNQSLLLEPGPQEIPPPLVCP